MLLRLFIGLFCLLSLSVFGQSLTIESSFQSVPITDFCDIYEDRSGQLSIDSIFLQPFEPNDKVDSVVAQVENGSAIWFRFRLNNKEGLQLFLYKDFAIYNEMELYWLENGQIQKDAISYDQSYNDRSFRSPLHAFKLDKTNINETIYYIKVKTNEFFKPSIFVAEKNTFYSYSSTRNIYTGIFYWSLYFDDLFQPFILL